MPDAPMTSCSTIGDNQLLDSLLSAAEGHGCGAIVFSRDLVVKGLMQIVQPVFSNKKLWKSTDDLGFTVELALSKVTGAKKGRAVDSCWLFLADVKAVLESFHVNVQPEVWENIVRSINHQHPGLSITLEHEPTNTHSNWIASAEQPFVAQFPCKASS